MNFKKTLVCLSLIAAITSVMFIALPAQALQEGPNEVITANHVKVRGSSTVWPISDYALVAFQNKYPAYTLDLPPSEGSGTGLDALTKISSGTVGTDVAASSKIPDASTDPAKRNYWNTEIVGNDYGMADLRIWPVGKDGIAIVVAANNPFYADIQQKCNAALISDVFCSTAFNTTTPLFATWGAFLTAAGVPSSDSHAINRFVRVVNSGTYDGFNTFFFSQGAKLTQSAIYGTISATARNTSSLALCTFRPENQEILNDVSSDPYAIGFIGLGFLEDNPSLIKGLYIGTGSPIANFVAPTKANVLNGSYKVDGTANPTAVVAYRWLWYATNGLPTMGSAGAIKTDFINYAHMNPQFVDQSGYIRMVWSDFTGPTAPSFASQDSLNAEGKKHPNLPDDNVDATDVTYFILAYNAQSSPTNPQMNPLCDYNADHAINAADVTQFILGYNGASAHTAMAYGPATGITG